MATKLPHAQTEHNEAVTEKKETIMSHLMAMRNLLVRIAIAIVVGSVASFYFVRDPLMKFIEQPILDRGIQIINLAVSEAFATQFRVSLISGIVLVSPFIFLSIWIFVKPALYDEEIRLFRTLFFCALFLFIGGIVFCYTCVYNLAITFFVSSADGYSTPMLSLEKYVSFLFSFLLPFGVAFELPVVLYIGARMGWTNYAKLAKARKYVFFGIFVLAAVLTPPDIVSQVMLGVPMYLLYELGIQVVRVTKPRHSEDAES